MAVYFLFAHDRCDRCGRITPVRSLSFFTSETVCMGCLVDEAQAMAELRQMGLDPGDFEACGCIPTPAVVRAGKCISSALLLSLRARRDEEGPVTTEQLRHALRRLRLQKAGAATPPMEPETGRGLPPAL